MEPSTAEETTANLSTADPPIDRLDVPEWGIELVRDFNDTLLSRETLFPCTFAVAGLNKATLRFGFVESIDDEEAWYPLLTSLSAYLENYRSLGRDTSFIAFFRPHPVERTLDEYRERFWSVLDFLHRHDPEPWPEGVPRDPDDPWWEFGFGGVPMFVVCNTPAHRRRRSRHSGEMLITFQPRWVFEGIEATTRRGQQARKVIRKRLGDFDGMEPSPHLGSYGDPENREWRQYFLPDDDHEGGGRTAERCPFRPSKTAERGE
ncbi:YqcI/YcgG family protein [Saccharothrix xinjiangensis]|uniref:YqcI/YcgG family protein n=1 Tax=Saccharothrix xinjiangensis TaxID=204798 RepID=A0ABV9Y2V5_9PSEU